MWTTNYAPMKSHENIYVFQKKGVKTKELTFNKKLIGIKSEPYIIKKAGKSSNYGFDDASKDIVTKSDGIRHPLSVQRIPSVQKFSKEYANFPTQKPVEIMEFFIRGMTDINDVVLDPYLGSGTTAVAAMRNLRMCIGAELDPVSFPIIKKRILLEKKQYEVKWINKNGFLSVNLPNMLEENN
jgi:site-specific DNA-methyltransferase (adenine-specific)